MPDTEIVSFDVAHMRLIANSATFANYAQAEYSDEIIKQMTGLLVDMSADLAVLRSTHKN